MLEMLEPRSCPSVFMISVLLGEEGQGPRQVEPRPETTRRDRQDLVMLPPAIEPAGKLIVLAEQDADRGQCCAALVRQLHVPPVPPDQAVLNRDFSITTGNYRRLAW